MADHLYVLADDGKYANGTEVRRIKDQESAVDGTPEWIVGIPRDIPMGGKMKRIISMISAVKPEWLQEIVYPDDGNERQISDFGKPGTEIIRVQRPVKQ
jgi:hypothetical protein